MQKNTPYYLKDDYLNKLRKIETLKSFEDNYRCLSFLITLELFNEMTQIMN